MDIEKAKEFKRLLFEGPVKFSFTKRDGTVREALGTMKRDLAPQFGGKKAYVCKNIQWDTDDEKVRLPLNVCVKDVPADLEGDELEEFLADELSGHYKFCVKNFEIEEKRKKTMSAGSVLFYDLERKGYRSCKIDSVVSFEAKA